MERGILRDIGAEESETDRMRHDASLKADDGEVSRSEAVETSGLTRRVVDELAAVQGRPADIGGYYRPDFAKLDQVMRPSATLNAALASCKA